MPGDKVENRLQRLQAWKSVPAAERFAKKVQEVVKAAQKCVEQARQRMIQAHEGKRREVSYQPGALVMLSTENLRRREPGARKLKPRYMGPFEVLKMVGPVAVKLNLPTDWSCVYSVFHVSLVKPYHSRSGQKKSCVGPPPLQWLDGEPLYEVETLLDRRERKKGRQTVTEYLVKWRGYAEENNTWEPRSNLLTCGELIADYERRVDGASEEE